MATLQETFFFLSFRKSLGIPFPSRESFFLMRRWFRFLDVLSSQSFSTSALFAG